MNRILLVDSSPHDAARYQEILAKDGLETCICASGAEVLEVLTVRDAQAYAVAIVLWEIPGTPSGFELLAQLRQSWRQMPVVVITGTLDADLATRAHVLGAKDFLEKPIEADELRSRIGRLVAAQDPLSPLVTEMRRRILGRSQALLAVLQQVANVAAHEKLCVLLAGESGTGKELFAKEIHSIGPRPEAPWVPVNVAAISEQLIESHLFGHEKGAFTGATEQRKGFLEEAGEGVLFLDEIGDLSLDLQVKLNRAIEARRFRLVGGKNDKDFKARLVCATHRDLATDVERGVFRRDLYYRIAETTIHVPPLRERGEDIDLLLDHFLAEFNKETASQVRLSREARSILRSYAFPGNVRELKNVVRGGAAQCYSGVILPQHLPLQEMGIFLGAEANLGCLDDIGFWPKLLFGLSHEDAEKEVVSAFDRHYLRYRLDQSHQNISRASSDAQMDPKTFRKRWEECGLPPLKARKDSDNA